MFSRQKELTEMRQSMAVNISKAKSNFEKMSPSEKVVYAQQAFADVNNYCSRLWNMNTENLSFGFMIGINAGGIAYRDGIAYSLPHLIYFDSPEKIYEVLFHEMKHVHQGRENTLANQLSRLYPSSKQREMTHNQWLANPKEINSDFFAHSQMIKIQRQAMLKSTDRVQACKELSKFKTARVKNVVEHIKGTVRAGLDPILKPIQRLFCHPKTQEQETYKVGSEGKLGTRFFNLGHLLKVFKENPSHFSELKNMKSDGRILRASIKEDEAHTAYGFFGINGALNKEQGMEALKSFRAENKTEERVVDPNIPQYTFVEDQASFKATEEKTEEGAEKTSEGVSVEGQTVQEGNPALKDEIIANIVSSREAAAQTESVSSPVVSEPVQSEQVAPEAVAVDNPVVETGGMEP